MFSVVDSEAIVQGFTPASSFQRGWARRPRRSQVYGVQYSTRFGTDMEEMFSRSEETSSLKASAAILREELIKKYPGRYDIPSEFDIKQKIQKYLGIGNAGTRNNRKVVPRICHRQGRDAE